MWSGNNGLHSTYFSHSRNGCQSAANQIWQSWQSRLFRCASISVLDPYLTVSDWVMYLRLLQKKTHIDCFRLLQSANVKIQAHFERVRHCLSTSPTMSTLPSTMLTMSIISTLWTISTMVKVSIMTNVFWNISRYFEYCKTTKYCNNYKDCT